MSVTSSIKLSATPSTLLTTTASDGKTTNRECNIQSLSRISVGKQLGLLPDVILTCIWHFFNLKGL
jgi:hypothetical protein